MPTSLVQADKTVVLHVTIVLLRINPVQTPHVLDNLIHQMSSVNHHHADSADQSTTGWISVHMLLLITEQGVVDEDALAVVEDLLTSRR